MTVAVSQDFLFHEGTQQSCEDGHVWIDPHEKPIRYH